MKTISLIVAAFVFAGSFSAARELAATIVSKEITAVVKALYTADYKLLLKHTHPKVLELLGGKKGFFELMKQSNKTVTDAGIKIEKVEVGKKIDYFAGRENEFLLVSTKITGKIAGKDDVTPGHQLGVKNKTDKVGKYIDCSALNDQLVRKWFPDFPKGKKIPKD